MNTKLDAPERARSHAYVIRHVKIRHGAAHRLIAYGMHPLMRRLYWMDTWMLDKYRESTEEKRAEYSGQLIDLRDKLKIAQNELTGHAQEAGMDIDKWETLEIKEELDVELRSPLAAGYLACITEFDKLLSMFQVMLEGEVISRRQAQQAVVVWRTEMWNTVKTMQANLDGLREQLDPERAERERLMAAAAADAVIAQAGEQDRKQESD